MRSCLFSHRPLCVYPSALSLCLLILGSLGVESCHAQTVSSGPSYSVQPGQPISAGQLKQIQEAQARQAAKHQNKPKKNDKGDKKKEDGKKEEKKEEGMKTVKRPTDKPNPVDLERAKLVPDENGMVQFNYNGHPWTDVLQDYADAAKLSFDWQELPADYLNLMTQRKYSLLEARDLLNQHLLVRGFTMVVRGEVLSVVKISQLDSSLIPRVEPDDLEDYAPYDFVRTRFQLPASMDPAKVKGDVSVLLSPHGKVTPLLATKRLLIIDAVANLRNVRDLIYDEQMTFNADIKPYFRKINHRRADYIADQIMIVLGRDPSSRKSPQEVAVQQQKIQLLMQMQKKGKDVSKMIQPDGPPIHIVVNKRENTLLINTTRDQIPIIDRTIEQLDVPEGGAVETPSGGSLSIKKYNTVTIGTEAIIRALNEIGYLDPRTQLQSDSKSKTIFAQATVRDHQKIQSMIDRLDGTGRKVTVKWLPHHLRADQVAGSIQALIVGPEKKKEENRRSYFWYWDDDRNDEDALNDGFRVLPDVENNRLLLWANEDELTEVEDLIEELEKNRDGSLGDNRKVRRFEARDPEVTRRLLEKLQENWTGENPLEIELPPAQEEQKKRIEEDSPEDNEDKITESWNKPSMGLFVQYESGEEKATSQAESGKADKKAPIKVFVNDEGEIVIASDDSEALKNLEEFMSSVAPPVPEFHTFKLKYILASTAALNLEEYFEDEIKQDGDRIRDWYGRWVDTSPEQGPVSLGSRPPLRFVYDPRSNTVTVSNASPSQIKVAKQLIEIYDAPPEAEEFYARETATIKVKYSDANVIAKSLKEVYRELLSSTDKEFQDKEGKTGIGGRKKPYVFGNARRNIYGDQIPVLIQFEGALSIGVDQMSNTLIISARAEILESIKETVKFLDQAAIPETVVHVHEVGGLNLDASKLQKAVAAALGQPWPAGRPPQQQAARGQGGGRNQPQSRNGDRRREGDRRRR